MSAGLRPEARAALDRQARLVVDEGPAVGPQLVGAKPQLTLTAERASDLFLANFSFYGFEIDKTSKPTTLVAVGINNSDIFTGVVVQLPPQAIGEADYAYQSGATLPFDPTPVLSAVAGPSRIAFQFAKGDTIPLPTMTAEDLLDWSGWTLNVPAGAVVGSGAQHAGPPNSYQTAIEAPYGLYLSPVVSPVTREIIYRERTYFSARTTSFTSPAGVTECWSATLESYVSDLILHGPPSGPATPEVAAVYARDYTGATATPWTNISYDFYSPPPQIRRPAAPTSRGSTSREVTGREVTSRDVTSRPDRVAQEAATAGTATT